MANKLSPNSLIHCAECGEDYSATYRRCPFCGAKNAPRRTGPGRPASGADLEDTYVFDGQELFDGEGDEDYTPANSRGGKRLAEKPMSNPFANADINWPRVITFICSLVIIVAAMIIVFTVIYPQLRGNPTADNSQNPSFSATDPAGENTGSADPSAAVTGPASTDPVTEPTAAVPPTSPAGLMSISFNRANDVDFTLTPGESHTIILSFTPASWSGAVTWTSTDTTVATVDANGKVTNVNTSGTLRSAVITATADGLSLESKVYCQGAAATQPPATEPPATQPPVTSPPATQAPSGSGGVTVGKAGVIVNVPYGVYIRSSPTVSGDGDNRIASLFNGDPITVLADAGNGWYKISFAGMSGTEEGYVMGDFISTD